MSAPRTFQELRGSRSDSYTSLAFWLGPYRGRFDVDAILGVAAAMSFQYDYEEQADAYGAALPEDQPWTRSFAPVAPVQLAAEWSPLPCAVEVLGEPTLETVEDARGALLGAAAWDAARVAAVKTTARSTTDAQMRRFLGLLTVSVTRAKEQRSGLLVVAKPGWSYDHVHTVSRATARLMTKAGFVVTTRRA